MCGIFGSVALLGREPSIDDAAAIRLRDLMTHRGPDGAGLWRQRNVLFAHRRLAVIDPGPAGAQPMITPDGRFVIVYNGELYNDAQIRRELTARSLPDGGFRTTSDTETVLHAFAAWGAEAFTRLRGMFALAIYDTRDHLLTLARDPLGIKPLYLWTDGREIVFASEPKPILAHPLVSVRPNLRMASAYLTTIRTVLGNDTLFEGILALRPGQMAQCHLAPAGGHAPMRLLDYAQPAPVVRIPPERAQGLLSAALEESVRLHLRADAPVCALLSGGLDSAVIALLARRELGSLNTYCTGAESDPSAPGDLAFARLVAQRFAVIHSQAPISRALFTECWPCMVRELGAPLSTPNEVAIFTVAQRLRADGHLVALSGEGADELLAGYEQPMLAAHRFTHALAMTPGAGAPAGLPPMGSGEQLSPGRFQLELAAWIAPAHKGAILAPQIARGLENDAWLTGWFDDEFDRAIHDCGPLAAPLDPHLRFLRRVNLTGLLQRLDTAMMLASVEGRTPFADVVIAALADSLPMSSKFTVDGDVNVGGANAPRARTKIALREAFRPDLPVEIVDRPKASFPLPFESWMADQAAVLRTSPFARSFFAPAARGAVASDPAHHWRLAWPMINLALWGDAWW